MLRVLAPLWVREIKYLPPSEKPRPKVPPPCGGVFFFNALTGRELSFHLSV